MNNIYQPYFYDCNEKPIPANWLVHAESKEQAFETAKALFKKASPDVRCFMVPHQHAFVLAKVEPVIFVDGMAFI